MKTKALQSKYLLMLIFLQFISFVAISRDAPITYVGNASACPGAGFALSVTVDNFTSVSSVTLRLDYNPQLMAYTSYSNVNSSLSGILIVNNTVSPTLHKIIVVWSNVNPVTLSNGVKLMDLNFTYLSGDATLTFNNTSNGGGDCEYGDENGDPMNDNPTTSFFINAQVSNLAVGPIGSISGTSAVSYGQSGVEYYVPPVTNATGYNWVLPDGATISSGNNTNTILVDFSGTAISGEIIVQAINSCGDGEFSVSFPVTVNSNPVINVTPINLSFGDVLVGTHSAIQTYTITGSNLTAPVTVTAPEGFFIHDINGRWVNTIDIPQTDGSLNATVTVCFRPKDAITYSENIINESDGVISQNISVTGTGIENNNPYIIIDPVALSIYNDYLNPCSTSVAYSIYGNHLTENLVVFECFDTPIAEFSLTEAGDYTHVLTVVPSNGLVDTIVYIRLCLWNPGYNFTYICHSSSGITEQLSAESVPVSRNAPVSTIGQITAVPGTLVYVPITVTGFTTINTAQYTIEYNPTVLSFVYSDNIHPFVYYNLESVIQIDSIHSQLEFTIFRDFDQSITVPDNAKLIDLVFLYSSGYSSLNFGECSFYNYWSGPLIDEPDSLFYIKGYVGPIIAKTINLGLNLEGLYNPSIDYMNKAQGRNFPSTVADEVTIGLALSTFPYLIEFEMDSVLLEQNGSCLLEIPGNIIGEYYIVIRHRNSIETWSANPVSFEETDITYDFTTEANKAYGDNMKLIGSKYCLFGGDVNQDGSIDTGDMSPVDNDASDYAEGYLPTDANGDGTVDIADMIIIDNNTSSFVGAYFPIASTPVLTTNTITNITGNTAICGGNITSDGGATIIARGVCWSTSPNPTFADNHTSNGSGTGSFISNISGLSQTTTYYIRAYATNGLGSAYGNQLVFTTTVSNLPVIITSEVTNITQITASSGGNITSDGGSAVLFRGVCWSTNPGPTISDNHTTNGDGTGVFVSNLTGLTINTLYYLRAYAVNSNGTNYGNEITFVTFPTVTTTPISNITQTTANSGGNVIQGGGVTIIVRGVCWSTSQNPTIVDNLTINGSGTGNYTSNLTGLTGNTVYYVRAYVTNGSGTSYGGQESFTTAPLLATVATEPVIYITPTTATSGGNVIHDGGASVTARGVCWSTTASPTIADNHTNNGSGIGAFISNLTGLNPSTTYYIRTYASNNAGTAYGNKVSFTTLANPIPPALTTTAITNILSTAATSGGNILSDGGAAIIFRGVCWSTSPNPTTSDSHTTDSSGSGTFVSNLSGLTLNTSYYVRAYAINSTGTAYGNELSFITRDCGLSFTRSHLAGSVAPVDKIVTYGIVDTYLSGSYKCWIAQNLGADHQASSATDATEEAAGWYWQYNRKRGFKHDGTTRTPNTTWITSINEDYWMSSNDPCTLLLGSGWRIPTKTEWEITVENGGWDNYNATYASVLKLHAAGSLWGGDLGGRGSGGRYWSSASYMDYMPIYAYNLFFTSDLCTTEYYESQTSGFPLRCLGNGPSTDATIPTVSTSEIININSNSAISGGNVSYDGGTTVTARGICWSTIPNPTLSDNNILNGSGTGSFISNITWLSSSIIYYVRAYATNAYGTAYGNEESFTTELITHGSGVIDIDNNEYNSVIHGNQEWMTENLKVTHYRNGDTIPNIIGNSWNSLTTGAYCWYNNDEVFYKNAYGALYNWYTIADSRDLCPNDWHIPNNEDWTTLTNFLGGADTAGGKMKSTRTTPDPHPRWDLPNFGANNISGFSGLPGGYRLPNGIFEEIGRSGYWWDSSVDNSNNVWMRALDYNGDDLYLDIASGQYGFSVRCLKGVDISILTTDQITNITGISAVSGGNISSDGGEPVIQKGVCWSTSPNPTIVDSHTTNGSGTGSFISTMLGLSLSTTYYVRAYATNVVGTAYGNQESFVSLETVFPCNNFTITHTAGNVAPIDKTVTYGVVVTDLSGGIKCWITQNLGADHQATSAADTTEASAGWYWQFNRKQGYKHDGTTRTPNTAWTSYVENSNWLSINDPCTLLLGSSWRLPTSTEWQNAAAVGGWNNYNETYASVLKLHAAGLVNNTLSSRGFYGHYWSSSQYHWFLMGNHAYYGINLGFDSSYSYVDFYQNKPTGCSLRCLSY